MTGYVLSIDADLDLDENWEYIAADNIGAADRWIEKLFDAFEALARTLGMGHKREDLTDRLSAAPFALKGAGHQYPCRRGALEKRSRIKAWPAGCPIPCHRMPHSS